MRLNVYLQKAGAGSRREAERLVAEGRVTVNGVKAAATTPVEEGDDVRLDGKPLAPETRSLPRLFLLNKPVDYLVTRVDPQGRKTVFDLPALKPPAWPRSYPRVMYVGRLDVNSEGLLVLSSDGPLAQAMMRPEAALKRVYRVRVKGRLTPGQIAELARGVTIEGISYRGVEFSEEEGHDGRVNRWYRCVLREGKNREIRRIFEHYGCLVNRLIRIEYGPFKLGDLASGELREAKPSEVKSLLDRLSREAKLSPGGAHQ